MTERHTHDWAHQPEQGTYACTHCDATSAECQTCRRPTRPGRPTGSELLICDRCLKAERKILDDTVDHAGNIVDPAETYTALKAVTYDLANTRGADDPARLPHGLDAFYDDDARGVLGVNTAGGIYTSLITWAEAWADALNDHLTGNEVDYLKDHFIWAAHNPHDSAWADYRTEIRQLRTRAAALDPTTPERVGAHCLDCGGPLVRDWTPTKGLGDTVTCELCDRAYTDTTYRLALLDQIRDAPDLRPDALVTEPDARRIFPALAPGTIRTWISRGHLTPAGKDRAGKAVYRVGDIDRRVRGVQEHAKSSSCA